MYSVFHYRACIVKGAAPVIISRVNLLDTRNLPSAGPAAAGRRGGGGGGAVAGRRRRRAVALAAHYSQLESNQVPPATPLC